MTRQAFWHVAELWPLSTVVILGGGASLTQDQVEACRDRVNAQRMRVRVIAVNNAYQRAPWADLHYFADSKWWSWHRNQTLYRNFGGIRVTLENPDVCAKDGQLVAVKNYGKEPGFSPQRDGVHTGNNAGYQAIQLAAHLGAQTIVLLGFDMKPGHWHGDHPQPTDPNCYAKMLPFFATLTKPAAKRGIEILNATPGSAIACFPRVSLTELFSRNNPERAESGCVAAPA